MTAPSNVIAFPGIERELVLELATALLAGGTRQGERVLSLRRRVLIPRRPASGKT